MRPLTSVAAFVAWHRRAIAALCVALATYLLAQQLVSPARDGTPVVVLSAEVAAGQRLTSQHVHVVRLPPDAAPGGAFSSPDDVLGQAPALPLPRGTPLSPAVLASSRSIEPGRALVPVAVGDERLLNVLRLGDRISLVVGTGESVDPVSHDARVAGLPAEEAAGALSVSSGRGGLMLVDVPEADAAAVAMLGQSGQLGIVLSAP